MPSAELDKGRPRCRVRWRHGARCDLLQLLAVRLPVAAVARPVPRLRGVEYAAGGARAAARLGRALGRQAGGRPRQETGRAQRRRSGRQAPPASAEGRGRSPARAHVDGDRRARSRARGRSRARIGRAARRLSGNRQVHAHEHGAGPPSAGRSSHVVREWGGVGRAGQAARRAARAGRAQGPDPRRDRSGHRPRDPCRGSAAGMRDRLGADAERRRAVGSIRLGRAGARGRGAGDGACQGARDRGDPGRARDEGRRTCRTARARASGRLRAAVRGRARASLSRAARPEESIWIDERGWAVRDAPGRARGGAGRLGEVRRRGNPRTGQRDSGRDGGVKAATRGGSGARSAI